MYVSEIDPLHTVFLQDLNKTERCLSRPEGREVHESNDRLVGGVLLKLTRPLQACAKASFLPLDKLFKILVVYELMKIYLPEKKLFKQ